MSVNQVSIQSLAELYASTCHDKQVSMLSRFSRWMLVPDLHFNILNLLDGCPEEILENIKKRKN
jgi:hypothetical protein